MAFEQKINEGAIFKNKKKTDPKHPDYNATFNIDGVEYQAAVYLNKAKTTGENYFKLAYIKRKEEHQKDTSRNIPVSNDLDDDIPF